MKKIAALLTAGLCFFSSVALAMSKEKLSCILMIFMGESKIM